MTIVVDSSMALAWAYHDEETPATLEALERVTNEGGCVPLIWRLEVANSLQNSVRSRRIDVAFRDRALEILGALELTIDVETNDHAWTRTLDVAERLRLTLYDASYLELAERRKLPLATLDKDLRRAAREASVSVVEGHELL